MTETSTLKPSSSPLIEVNGVIKHFPIMKSFAFLSKERPVVHAVDGVWFQIIRGETFGLVGESGCGKTTLGRIILRLIDPSAGTVLFEGTNVLTLKGSDLKNFRKRAQIVFQNPFGSLDPRMKIRDIVGYPAKLHGLVNSAEDLRRVALNLLKRVGLEEEHLMRLPHEFSGGQRQRIAIARALSVDPDFIVLDEPTSSLDVSVQAQIINLLQDLQAELGLTYLFISHNLSLVASVSDRVAVMYLGKIVEIGTTEEVFQSPRHPYSQALMAANPIPDPETKHSIELVKGEVPSAISPPSGCRYRTRCPFVMDICSKTEPPLHAISNTHFSACHLEKSASADTITTTESEASED
jgi:oligopeptide/dipeptide ABC transporter ATP-binding protein